MSRFPNKTCTPRPAAPAQIDLIDRRSRAKTAAPGERCARSSGALGERALRPGLARASGPARAQPPPQGPGAVAHLERPGVPTAQ
jgi:hypothetical protein